MAKIFKYKNGAKSPEHPQFPRPYDNLESERMHLQTAVHTIPVITGIGWVDFQPDESLNEFENEQKSPVIHPGKDLLQDFQESNLPKDFQERNEYSNYIEEVKKKKRRRFRRRSRRRKSDRTNVGQTEHINGRGEKRKLECMMGGQDQTNDIDISPKLSPKALDPSQVQHYILTDPGLSNKRRRFDRKVGTLGSPPDMRKLGPSPDLVYSPTRLRESQSEHSAGKWPTFLDPLCKNSSGFWDPLIFHEKTAEKVRKMGVGAAHVDITVGKNLKRGNSKGGFNDKHSDLISILKNRKGSDRSHLHKTKCGDEVWTEYYQDIEHHSKKDLLPKIESKTCSFGNNDKKRKSNREIQNEFKKDIKDIVKKTLSADAKNVKITGLFQSEIENIDSSDNFENFSDNESGEELLNLPDPVPALRKNTGNVKESSLINLPVPALMKNTGNDKESALINLQVPALRKNTSNDKESALINLPIPAIRKNTGNNKESTLINLPVPALRKNTGNDKESALINLLVPVPAVKKNICDKKSTSEIIKAMKYTKCRVELTKLKIREPTAISKEVTMIKPIDKEINKIHDVNQEISKLETEAEEFEINIAQINGVCKEVYKIEEIYQIEEVYQIEEIVNEEPYIFENVTSGKVKNYTKEDVVHKEVFKEICNIKKLDQIEEMANKEFDHFDDVSSEKISHFKEDSQIEKVVHNEVNKIDQYQLGQTEEMTNKEFDHSERGVAQTDEANNFCMWLNSENDHVNVVHENEEQIEEVDKVDEKEDNIVEINEQKVDESEEIILKVDLGEYDVKYCFICQEYDHFMRNDCLVCKGCGSKGHSIKDCSPIPIIIDKDI